MPNPSAKLLHLFFSFNLQASRPVKMSDSGTKRRISPDTLTDIAKRRRSKDGDTDEVPQQFTLPSQLGELVCLFTETTCV